MNKIDYYVATGKRKTSIARIFLKKGNGEIRINNIDYINYFNNNNYTNNILAPLIIINNKDFDIIITVKGGGLSSQSEAILHGISKSLIKYYKDSFPEDDFNKVKKILRSNGFLTRDSRIVERKKPGLHKARKSSQYSKR